MRAARKMILNPATIPPPGPATVASDAFTRANSATTLGTANVGGTWVPANGTWGISSNKAYLAGAADQANFAQLDVGMNSYTVSADVTLSTVRASCGLCVRGSSGFGLLVRWRKNTAQGWDYLESFNGGAFTSQIAGIGATLGSTYHLSTAVSGATALISVDGVLKSTVTSGIPSTGSKVGLLIWSSGSGADDDGGSRIDNFLVTNP